MKDWYGHKWGSKRGGSDPLPFCSEYKERMAAAERRQQGGFEEENNFYT
jgi:hypothetical protein